MATSTTGLGLERIRRRKGVTLQEIAESTKIGTFFLKAIEDEDFAKLPGGVFDRNYLRQYAAAAGIEDAKLLASYERFKAEQAMKEAAGNPKRNSALRWLSSFVVS